MLKNLEISFLTEVLLVFIFTHLFIYVESSIFMS
jgi:hypothetical protein